MKPTHRIILAQPVLLSLFLSIIYLAAGARGFTPFLNLEALLLVLGGTLALTWCSKRPQDDLESLIKIARARAIAMGGLGSLLGLILLLSSVEDLAAVPRRIALALVSLFFGVFLSEVVLAPFERPHNGR